MRLRQLRIRLQTTDGPYGTAIDFPDGLVVVRADNTMGKSTCVKSILVALGMEQMLTTIQSELPLTPAVLARLDGANNQPADVLESKVYLEIENYQGSRITVQRTLKGNRDNHLVTVHEGPALSQPSGAYPATDYFVNRPGGASRERGFHRFLANFLGWDLPKVPSFDGNEVPLYLQCLFPFFAVEQTRGWSSIVPPVPTHLRVKDAHKRAVEFILNLDARKIALRRQELQQERSILETEWTARRRQSQDIARRAAAQINGLPHNPTGLWPPAVQPSLIVPMGETWVPLEQQLDEYQTKQKRLTDEQIPRVKEVASAAATELNEAEVALRSREAILARRMDKLRMEQAEVASVNNRLLTLNEDIQRNQDIETLRALGATRFPSVNAGTCPVCHHPIQDTLVPLPDEQQVMSVKDNIDFLKEQKKTYHLVLENGERVVLSLQQKIAAAQAEVTALRDDIRALRQTLVVDGRMPSIAAIRERMQLEDTIKKNAEVLESFTTLLEEFGELAARWQRNQTALKQLPKDDTSEADKVKIAGWSSLFREQLERYGFMSLPVSQLAISSDDYRPEHDGFPLQASISASDLIRTIWAYLEGMLEISRTTQTNHPGFLIFDEPRQQSTRDVSFAQLLRRASGSLAFKQQVIFFTSEKLVQLNDHLNNLPHHLREFTGRVIAKE